MVSTAEEQLTKKDYYNALDWYNQAYEERNDKELAIKIAELHLQLRDYAKAERWYQRVLRQDKKNEYGKYRYDYGRVLKLNGNYDEAKAELQQFIMETDDPIKKELAENELSGIDLIKVLQPTKGLTVEHAGRNVNTTFIEYSPVPTRDGKEMYFAGYNRSEIITLDGKDPDVYCKIFVSEKSNNSWSKPKALDQKINREGYHTSNPRFSSDGRRMFFTRALLEGNVMSESKIFESTGGEGQWGPAVEVSGVNGNYLATHPAAGDLFGKEVLFFVSNMDGGNGGFDIYYATRKGDGVYGDPVNLGPKINSPGDETTPFYRDGTLYFSSTGHPGMGGADIFYSTWNGSVWSEPRNMGPGYNTNVDDAYFSVSSDGTYGFLTSNREDTRSVNGKTCCDDIYAFNIAQITADLVVGTFDVDTRKPLMGATVNLIEIVRKKPTGSDAQTNATGNVFNFPLALEKSYKIVATAPGYFPDSTEFNTVGLQEITKIEKRLRLKTMAPPPVEDEYETYSTEEPIELGNIFYDYNDDKILPASEPDLSYLLELMNDYNDMVIELSSHTDARGVDDYNQRLSQRRAESARNWLLARGISPERIKAVGYGETQIRNQCTNGVECTDDEHRYNRRTEFRIISGPTSIRVEKQRLKKKDGTKTGAIETPGGRKVIRMSATPPSDTVKISHYSSLYGTKDLKGAPIMQFDRRELDLGSVKKGEKRTFEFKFVNKGDTPLKIDIISACDCTSTNQDDLVGVEYQPGQGATLIVTFDSTEKDEDETIPVDIILGNNAPNSNVPIIERVEYSFKLVK